MGRARRLVGDRRRESHRLVRAGSGCINSGDEKIFPEEIEAAGAPELTLGGLQEHCRTKIAGYKVPRERLVGAAPRTNTIPPDYATVRQIVLARLA